MKNFVIIMILAALAQGITACGGGNSASGPASQSETPADLTPKTPSSQTPSADSIPALQPQPTTPAIPTLPSIPDTPRLPVPVSSSWADVGIAPANRQITVNWTKRGAASGADARYNLYWGLAPGVTSANGFKISNVSSPFVHTGLTNNVMYYYIVTENIAGAESSASLEVAASPQPTELPITNPPTLNPPVGITLTTGTQQITITWNQTAAATALYRLYVSTRQPQSAADLLVGNTPLTDAAVTSYIHSGLQTGVTYYYAVTTVLGGEESAPGSLVAAHLW